MICQKCKSTEATVHSTTIVNGAVTENHLCANCSGTPADIQGLVQSMLAPFPGLAPLFSVPNTPSPPSRPVGDGILGMACPHCGITLRDIQKTGQLGCPRDYSVFGDMLSQMIAAAQAGNMQHVGKVPNGASAETRRAVLQARVDGLQRRLKGAVFREDYELAARCRDEISAMLGELKEV